MTDERSRRVVRNEALYRQVNERVEELNETFGEISGDFSVVCECGDLACLQQITLSRDAYERTRAHPARFIVKPGHEAPDLEEVVERAAGFVVIEKHSGAPQLIAEETDPRS